MRLLRLIVIVVIKCGLLASFAQSSASGSNLADYLLQPGDIISVQVFKEEQLNRELRVSQTGEVFLPLIGRIDVKGQTTGAVEAKITELYARDYLVNPQINVIVIKYQIRTVNVIGAVNAPQAIEHPPEQTLTLLDAISRAGGFNRFADKKRVRLTRVGAGGKNEIHTINADELLAGDGKQWVLRPDDVVFIPERLL